MAKTRKSGSTYINGQLEIDHNRGVIYFHASDGDWIAENKVVTVLRIEGLPRPIPEIKERMLDIAHLKGTDWNWKEQHNA